MTDKTIGAYTHELSHIDTKELDYKFMHSGTLIGLVEYADKKYDFYCDGKQLLSEGSEEELNEAVIKNLPPKKY